MNPFKNELGTMLVPRGTEIRDVEISAYEDFTVSQGEQT